MATSQSNEFSIPKLKLANRLLLSVLLSYADECGVVRGVGISDLMKLTGMSKDRLQSQLNKLKAQGYIRASISGVTGSFIFGVAKGLYWLNLSHENYQEHAYPSNIVTIPIGYIYGSSHQREVSDIYNISKIINDAHKNNRSNNIEALIKKAESTNPYLSACLNNIHAIAYFFQDCHASRVRQYLQSKLDEYACFIMSNNLEDINGLDCHLENKIMKDLFPASFTLKKANRSIKVEELKSMVTEFIYKISLAVVSKLNTQLKLIPEIPFDCVNYTLVSMFDKRQHQKFITVEMFYKDENPGVSNLYRVKQEHFAKREYSKEVENELNIDEKYIYGLLTRPKNKEDRWPVRLGKVNSVPE